MDKNNAIEVRNMTKYFKVEYDKPHTLKERLLSIGKGSKEVHTVLNNINLDIKKGETVCLIGTNGSGKSTLLKLMTKIIYPNEGTIETNGKLTSLLELGAGFHPDFPRDLLHGLSEGAFADKCWTRFFVLAWVDRLEGRR